MSEWWEGTTAWGEACPREGSELSPLITHSTFQSLSEATQWQWATESWKGGYAALYAYEGWKPDIEGEFIRNLVIERYEGRMINESGPKIRQIIINFNIYFSYLGLTAHVGGKGPLRALT